MNEELATCAPDLAAASDPAEPGMHRTQSVDYGVVLDGEIWLELDDGAQTRLTRGDTIVQLAGRHAWRNKTDRPATVAFVLTGAADRATRAWRGRGACASLPHSAGCCGSPGPR